MGDNPQDYSKEILVVVEKPVCATPIWA